MAYTLQDSNKLNNFAAFPCIKNLTPLEFQVYMLTFTCSEKAKFQFLPVGKCAEFRRLRGVRELKLSKTQCFLDIKKLESSQSLQVSGT
jgi:hypothetical protein